MRYDVESVRDIQEEMWPLLKDHYHEIAWRQDKIDLNPNFEQYGVLEDIGGLVIVTARDAGELVGYNAYFVQQHIHYQDHKYAINDVVFLKPEYRTAGNGVGLFQHAHKVLKELGCTVVTIHMKTKQPFQELADGLGYEMTEYTYFKYLGE